jgi:hypothetical protein
MSIEGIREFEERWKNENMLELVHRVLSRTIKRDDHVKLLVFLTALSAYSDSPINLFLKGESGSGKSYITKEVLKLFPRSDVSLLAMLSPKALIHEQGIQMLDGKPIAFLEKPKKPNKKDYKTEEEYQEAIARYEQEMQDYVEKQRRIYWYLNFDRKIIAFLEIPDQETFRSLYSLLSHDERRIEHKFTDKTEKGMLITRNVVIEGWPATIFCTTDRKYVEELATRSLTVTPETSQEKIRDAMRFIAEREAGLVDERDDPDTLFLKRVIEHIKIISQEYKVKVPFPELDRIIPEQILKTRNMRDFARFEDIIKTIALLYFPQRDVVNVNGEKFILANIDDVLTAFQLYMRIKETTETGTEENIIRFYYDIVATKNSWSTRELLDTYQNKYKVRRSITTIRKWLERLEDLGYVISEDDPNDKRQKIWRPQIPAEIRDITRISDETLDWLENQRGKWLDKIRETSQLTIEKKVDGVEKKKPHIMLLSEYLLKEEKTEKEESVEEEIAKEPEREILEKVPQQVYSTANQFASRILSEQSGGSFGLKEEIKNEILAKSRNSELNLKEAQGDVIGHEMGQETMNQKSQENMRSGKDLVFPQSSPIRQTTDKEISKENNIRREWEELNKRLLEYAEKARESGPLPACKYCAFWQGDENSWLGKCIKTDSITNREYSCEKYVWKNEVMKRKEAVEEMVHKSTYSEKIKEMGNGWTAYSLPLGKDYRCSICGERAFVKIMRYVNGEKEEKMLCSSCFSLLKKEGGVS